MRKLRHSRSHMMTTYYGFLWGITLLNSLRCLVQMLQLGGAHATLWNTLWLLTRFGEGATWESWPAQVLGVLHSKATT
jgi:hypothetical protein